MAKLSSCYPLCPLIDRSPIGVTSDSVPGCAIVTLGKNIVIRYKLADQKQVGSWSSKDKLSAPVIYDEAGKRYIAVFNQSIVRTWQSTEVDLNKPKKLKFDHPIHSLLNRTSNSEPVVIFKNGAAVSISAALADKRKLWPGPLSSEMTIRESFFIKLEDIDCIAIVASDEKGQTVLEVVEVDNTNGSLFNVPIGRPEKKLLGQTVIQAEGTVGLVTLWNDGQLLHLPLKKSTANKDSVGNVLYTVKSVSLKNFVAMTQISTHHLAIYGADPSEEGAMLIVVNTQFMLVQAHQHYKLFSNNTNLWIIGTNLLLVVGHSLAVVPYLLDTERLCALIGSHKPLQLSGSKSNEVEHVLVMENVSWEDQSLQEDQDQDGRGSSENSKHIDVKNFKNSPESVINLVSQGYSQAMLCEKLIPSLLEELKILPLIWLLKNLPDFPESALIKILIFCLDAPTSAFRDVSLEGVNGVEYDLMEIDGEDSRDGPNTLVELSSGQKILLDIIIRTPFSEAMILPFLRSRLNLPHCLALLQYVAQSLPHTTSISHAQALMRWAAVLLDSHYQQLLLSKDECIPSTVTALKELVETQIEYMDDLKMLHPMLERVKGGHSLQSRTVTNNFYSIETLRLY